MKITLSMMKRAKPAVYTGYQYNGKTHRMKSICWPACQMPGAGKLVLMERQCKSTDAALKLATKELAKRVAAASKKR